MELRAQLKSAWQGQIQLQTKDYHIERSDVEEDIEILKQAEEEFWQKVLKRQKPKIVMNRYDEYMKEVQEKKKENQVIVNKIVEILKSNNLTVEHIEVILNMTREEVIKKAHL